MLLWRKEIEPFERGRKFQTITRTRENWFEFRSLMRFIRKFFVVLPRFYSNFGRAKPWNSFEVRINQPSQEWLSGLEIEGGRNIESRSEISSTPGKNILSMRVPNSIFEGFSRSSNLTCLESVYNIKFNFSEEFTIPNRRAFERLECLLWNFDSDDAIRIDWKTPRNEPGMGDR